MDKFGLSLVVGATLAQGFNSTIGKSVQQISRVGETVNQTKKDLDRFSQFRTLKQNTISAEKAWKEAQATVAALATELKNIENPTQKQSRAFENAQKSAQRAKQAFLKQSQQLNALRQDMYAAGQSTRDMATQQKKLGATLEALTEKHKALQAVQSKRVANSNRRAELRGQIVDTIALGAAIQAPIGAAIEFESAMADVKKVIDFDSPEQFRQMQNDILGMVTDGGIPLAASQMSEIVAAAGRAGIARNELKQFALDAAKMGVAFDMSAQQAGAAMTGMRTIFQLNQKDVVKLGDAINFLDNNMDATAAGMIEIANRAGSTAKLFGLTGQQTAALGATFLALKTPPEVAATGINAILLKLKTADRQSAQFRAALDEIGYSAEGLKEAIENDAQGALIGFLEQVQKADDVQGVLSELFGMEYSDDMAKLVDGLDQYKKAVDLSSQETAYAGAMQKEFDTRAATTANSFTLLTNRVNRLAINVGSVLLPSLNSVIGVVGGVVDVGATLAQQFPTITTVVVGLATGLAAVKIASLAVGYTWSFVSGGALALKGAWIGLTTAVTLANARFGLFNATTLVTNARLRMLAVGTAIKSFGATLVGFATRAIPVVIGGVRALTVALMTNPIGLVVGGIALAAGAVITHWDAVKTWFTDNFGDITKPVGAAFDWIENKVETVIGGVGKAIEWVGSLFGDDDKSASPQKEATTSNAIGKTAKATVGAAAIASSLSGAPVDSLAPPPPTHQSAPQTTVQTQQSPQTSVTQHFEIHIHQQQGQDMQELARAVVRELEKLQRGGLYDS